MQRFRIIEECLKETSKKYTKKDLKEKVNLVMESIRHPECCVSVKTIFNDLKAMDKMLGNENRIVSKRDGHATYYRYENDRFNIFNTELNDKEWNDLQAVIQTLSKFRGVDGYGWIDRTMLDLEYKFGYAHENRGVEEVLSFDNNERFIGREYIDGAIDAAVKHHPLHIIYEPFGMEAVDWTIHPWHVKQYNNRWFLMGYVDEEECVRTCALDRIKKMERALIQFKYNRSIDYKTYFDDIVGVTVPTLPDNPEVKRPAEDILLKFSERDFNYVVTKPLHKSQDIVDEEQKLISLHLIINREFINKILAFGSKVEVITPGSLRAIIKRNAEEMLAKYTDKTE